MLGGRGKGAAGAGLSLPTAAKLTPPLDAMVGHFPPRRRRRRRATARRRCAPPTAPGSWPACRSRACSTTSRSTTQPTMSCSKRCEGAGRWLLRLLPCTCACCPCCCPARDGCCAAGQQPSSPPPPSPPPLAEQAGHAPRCRALCSLCCRRGHLQSCGYRLYVGNYTANFNTSTSIDTIIEYLVGICLGAILMR